MQGASLPDARTARGQCSSISPTDRLNRRRLEDKLHAGRPSRFRPESAASNRATPELSASLLRRSTKSRGYRLPCDFPRRRLSRRFVLMLRSLSSISTRVFSSRSMYDAGMRGSRGSAVAAFHSMRSPSGVFRSRVLPTSGRRREEVHVPSRPDAGKRKKLYLG